MSGKTCSDNEMISYSLYNEIAVWRHIINTIFGFNDLRIRKTRNKRLEKYSASIDEGLTYPGRLYIRVNGLSRLMVSDFYCRKTMHWKTIKTPIIIRKNWENIFLKKLWACG